MPFFPALILLFVAARVLGGRRRRRWGHRHWYGYQLQTVEAVLEPRRETAYETLKQRYIRGELSDDRYQDELDKLLKTPEGRSQIQ